MPGYIKVGKNSTVTVLLIFFTKKAHKRRSYAGLQHYATFPEKVTQGGWIKKKKTILRRFCPQSSIHTLGPYSSHPPPTFHHHIRNNFPSPSVSLTPIPPSDHHFEQTAYLRRFPHFRDTSISCYFVAEMSLYCRKTPYFRSISLKTIELSFNFKQFNHPHAETSAF